MQYVRPLYRQVIVGMLLLVSCVFLLPIAMRAATARFTYESVIEAPRSDIALVLGASVVHGEPSPILAERADVAIALYKEGKVSKILVTGDDVRFHDEVTPVKEYLLNAGIPAQDIFLDHAGFDTYSSMYRARDVFLAKSVTIVTQDFHLPRALWIARRLGLSAYGVVAEGGEGSLYDYLREVPASLKAFFNIMLDRKPQHLGPVTPLYGNGTDTWED